MKKLFALIMAIILCLGLVACNVNITADTKDETTEAEDETTTSEDETTDTTDISESTDDSTEPDVDGDYETMVFDTVVAYMDATGEWYEGMCAFCEGDVDEDGFVCDDCIASDVCIMCDDDFSDDETIMCEDCLSGLWSYIETVDEIEDEEYSDDDEMSLDYYISVEDAALTLSELAGIEAEYGVCFNCASEADADYLFCDDCINSDTCTSCEEELANYEVVLCTACLDEISSLTADEAVVAE